MHKIALELEGSVTCGEMAAERALKLPISDAVRASWLEFCAGRKSHQLSCLHPNPDESLSRSLKRGGDPIHK